LVFHGLASAQSSGSGSIAGVVRDATGAVLPGVTVEAASPALIEKTRTVVTDELGAYRVVELRPGTYSVTFTLPGFSTVKRDGIELTTGFTATVNVELSVGSVDETITVSGASPVVDTQNVRSQSVLSRELLDTLPTARTFSAFASLTPGVSGGAGRDVGGNKGEGFSHIAIHGNAYGFLTFDGLKINSLSAGSNHRTYINQLFVQEVVLETGGVSADSQSGGLNVNVVPKDGGNAFRGTFSGEYTNKDLQSDNLTDELRARGLTRSTRSSYIYDAGAGYGGPIKRDKIWFYTAFRKWDSATTLANVFYNKRHGTPFYEEDFTRPGDQIFKQRDFSARVTWAATEKHKLAFTHSDASHCLCWFNLQTGNMSPEAAININYRPNTATQLAWSYPASSRLLFDVAVQRRKDYQDNTGDPGMTADDRPYLELSRNIAFGSAFGAGTTPSGLLVDYGKPGAVNYHVRANTSYITGSHAFKVGMYSMWATQAYAGHPNFPVRLVLRNGVPVSLDQRGIPPGEFVKVDIKQDLGIYAQDQWTIRRWTLNLGVRFDYFNGEDAAQTRPADDFIPELRFDAVKNVPNWKDISPRFGVAYDLFGNGKTAIKAQLGRYMLVQTTQIASALSPALSIVTATSRGWTDTNNNYLPDCDLKNPLANGECLAMANRDFGTARVGTRFSDEVLGGWGVRPYTWQGSLVLQQELRPGTGLTVGYYRTSFGNPMVLQDLARSPSDYDPFCITAPVNAQLPTSGSQLCGFYDQKREKFGVPVNGLVVPASNFGDLVRRFDGVDATVSSRFGRGGLLSGGLSWGRTLDDVCAIARTRPDVTPSVGGITQGVGNTVGVDVFGPLQSSDFCRYPTVSTELKLSGSYPLPVWGLQASATFQNLDGIPLSATYVATNAEVATSLGRNLAACPAVTGACNQTATLSGLVRPSSVREKRNSQLDVRLSKAMTVRRVRLVPRLDVYNLFNAATVLNINNRLGTSYLTPTDVLGGRIIKFGGQVDF